MIRALKYCFLLFLISSAGLYGQQHGIFDEAGGKGLPVFRYNVFRSLTGNEGHFIINIHAEIPNERLKFQKRDSVYEASYLISSAVFRGTRTDGIPLFQKKESGNLSVSDYKKTQSVKPESHHNFRFEAKNGDYTVVLTLKDNNTNKSYRIRRSVEFTDKSDLIVSDMRMVYWTDDTNFENSYSELINNVVDKQSGYTGALFEIFSSGPAMASLSLRYRILNSSGAVLYDDSFTGEVRDKLQYQVLKIPLDNLLAGNYKIEMDLQIGKRQFRRSTVFYLRWSDLSLNVSDINTALEQMLYVTEFDSISHVFEYDEEGKKAWFKEFWNDREVSMNLKSNSLMEEYFRRVAYANLHFSVPQKAGWKTDMGKVLCMMGDPDEIQSYPFAKNQKPYEVWIYYELNAQYIFDFLGGEYRLRK